MPRELTVATSDLATADLVLNVGPHHPAAHGVLRLALAVEGEEIVRAEPLVGHMHRGAEKLFEARDYRQIVMLSNRHDWLSAFNSELGVVLAVERMAGIEVPVRAVWARMLLAEVNRVLNHLVFLAHLPADLVEPASTGGLAARERLQAVMEALTGGRMHVMFNRVGGLKEDLPEDWVERARAAFAAVRQEVEADLAATVFANEGFRAGTRGVGVLDPALVPAYGLSGPVARGSGVRFDLRVDDPYLAYAELPPELMRIPVRDAGDCLARYECLLEEIQVSLDIAEHCLDVLAALPPGPINTRLPKTLRAPEGETYVWTENPLGANGYYLVSRGGPTPWRLKLRTASFNNVQALSVLLPGQRLTDLVAILASMFFVVGDIDK